MKNKVADHIESPVSTEPFLVEAIVEVLNKDIEAIEVALAKKDLFDKN